jgi:PadR family transcriptional regulator, regulatory protein PadR
MGHGTAGACRLPNSSLLEIHIDTDRAYLFTLGKFRTSLMAPSKQANERDLFPGALEMMILQTLKWQPMHGYALVQHLKSRSRDLLQVEEGSLYPALQRLLRAGMLKADWETSAANRRVRTYKITPAGVKHLEREVSSFAQMLKGISLVLTPTKS